MNEVEQYINQFAPEIQARLQQFRQCFFEILPQTKELIRYKMPAFQIGEQYLYFSACKKHIGFYPVYSEQQELKVEMLPYRAKNAKNSLHFPHNQPLPLDLIKQIIVSKSKSPN